MKKILGILSALLMTIAFQAICYAIRFSQPQDVGQFGLIQAGVFGGGISFTNATVKGSYFTKYNKNNNRSYEKGVARFGSGEDALYVHFDLYGNSWASGTYVGSKDFRNSFAVNNVGQKISKISTDEGITIYPLLMEYGPETEWTIVGRQKDGKFVKYIDTRDITQRYFGWNLEGASPVEYRKIEVRDDTIILYYLQPMQNRNWNKFDGEFRFKWDDNAQWFGVEQVAYSPSSDPVNIKAQQELASYGIQETVKSTTFGSNSNGFLVRTANDVFAVDRKNHQVAKIEIANLLSSMKAGKSSGLSVLIFNDTYDEDNNYGEWRGQNHFIPILLLDKYDASSNKYNSPYMYTGPGANPYRMHGFLKEQKHKDLVLLILKELFSHNDFDLSSL